MAHRLPETSDELETTCCGVDYWAKVVSFTHGMGPSKTEYCCSNPDCDNCGELTALTEVSADE